MEEALRKLFFDTCSEAIKWGPGLLIAILMLYGFYRLFLTLGSRVGLKIIAALDEPSKALTRQADALTTQSESMDRLTHSIHSYVERDATEHQEIIILQKVIRQELKESRDTLKDMRKFLEARHGSQIGDPQ